MPEFRWYPGPDEADEFGSLTELRNGIASNVFSEPVRRSGWGQGETGTQPFIISSWGYNANGGMPYLYNVRLAGGGGAYFQQRFRFSAALHGMLDPLSWFPGIWSGLRTVPQADFATAASFGTTIDNALLQIQGILDTAGLTPSAIGDATVVRQIYSWGPNVGQLYGYFASGGYEPNASEQAAGVASSKWTNALLATDAYDGTIARNDSGDDLGSSLELVPQVIVQQGDQEAGWNDLAGGVSDVGGKLTDVDNTLKDLDLTGGEIEQALNRAFPLGRNTVTHASDEADPSTPVSWPEAGEEDPIFVVGSVLPVIASSPSLLPALPTAPALLAGTVAAVGVYHAAANAAGYVTQVTTGWERLKELADWVEGASNPVQQVATETQGLKEATEGVRTALERIADALEAIQGELVRDPENPLTKPGLVNVTELASQARSEITLRSHGQLITASTGVIVEE